MTDNSSRSATQDVQERLADVVSAAATIIEGQDPYFAEASAKFIVRELVWSLVDRTDIVPDDMADHLDVLAGLLREVRPRDDEDRDPR